MQVLFPEVAEVTFSDSDSTPVPKFLNSGPDPGPTIFQIWESNSCSESGYNHRSNRNLPMFLLKKWPHRFLLQPKLKSDFGSGSVFSQNFDSGSGCGSERITQNPAGVDSGTPDPVPPLLITEPNDFQHYTSMKYYLKTLIAWFESRFLVTWVMLRNDVMITRLESRYLAIDSSRFRNRCQKVFSRWLTLVQGLLTFQNLPKLHWFIVFHIVAATMLRHLEPPKERVDPTTLCVTAVIEFSPLD